MTWRRCWASATSCSAAMPTWTVGWRPCRAVVVVVGGGRWRSRRVGGAEGAVQRVNDNADRIRRRVGGVWWAWWSSVAWSGRSWSRRRAAVGRHRAAGGAGLSRPGGGGAWSAGRVRDGRRAGGIVARGRLAGGRGDDRRRVAGSRWRGGTGLPGRGRRAGDRRGDGDDPRPRGVAGRRCGRRAAAGLRLGRAVLDPAGRPAPSAGGHGVAVGGGSRAAASAAVVASDGGVAGPAASSAPDPSPGWVAGGGRRDAGRGAGGVAGPLPHQRPSSA